MPESKRKTGFRGPSPEVGKATQFKPGQSGNPGGRPKETPITDALRQALSDPAELERFISAVIKKAKKGDVKAFQAVSDRIEGKPAQALNLGGADGGPIVFRLERIGKAEERT